MFKRLILTAMAAVILFAGCRKAEFKMEFELPVTTEANYTLLYYASDSRQGFIREQVALVQKGVCELIGTTGNPTLVYLFQGAAEPGALFYAERGDKISIKGDNPSPLSWHIGGNDITEALSDWRQSNRDALAARDAAKINAAVSKYVSCNSDNPASAILLLVYYDRTLDQKGFSRLWKSLKGDAAEDKWASLVGRSDMADGFSDLPAKVPRLILRTDSGFDTINPAQCSMLIYLSNNGTETRSDDIAAIRKLVSRTDSARKMVVDINLEMDSMAWHYQAERDSLRGAVRAWMPLGYSDSVALELGLVRIPEFIVTSRGGKIIYRGADADKAAAAFTGE